MRIGSLFSGYGGLDMAVEAFFNATTAWTSDIDPGASKIIECRYPHAPNLGDITKINWADIEPVDILAGGWPCQPFSLAGKRKGADDERALWPEVAKAVRALRPRYVVLENVAAITTAGELGRALADLAALRYVGQWRCLRASDIGAPHGRARIFILATNTEGSERRRTQPKRVGTATRPTTESGERASTAANPESSGLQGLPIGSLGRTSIPSTSSRVATDTRSGGRWEEDSRGCAVVGQGSIQTRWDEDSSAPGPHRHAAADTGSERHGRRQNSGMVGRLDRREEGPTWQRERPRELVSDRSATNWGAYEPAIRRWGQRLGRLAPPPTETSPRGAQRLSPAFVEWMMGLPQGWVTDVPDLNRNAQLKALGNGVVPQQALAALQQITSNQERAAS